MERNRAFWRNLILYGLIGGLSAGVDAGVFFLLHTGIHVDAYMANIISVHIGIFLSFFLNSRYNFKKIDRLAVRFLLFYGTGILGLILSSGILWAGEQAGFPVLYVKLASIVIVAGFQFLINKIVTFRN